MPCQPDDRTDQQARYVVLQHEDRQGVHFDLMIDAGPYLATWKCPRPPELAAVDRLACTRIQDHRRLYLDYEGPISRDRGLVRRYDAGTCLIHCRRPDRWEATFAGQRLSGRFALVLADQGESAWYLCSVGS